MGSRLLIFHVLKRDVARVTVVCCCVLRVEAVTALEGVMGLRLGFGQGGGERGGWSTRSWLATVRTWTCR